MRLAHTVIVPSGKKPEVPENGHDTTLIGLPARNTRGCTVNKLSGNSLALNEDAARWGCMKEKVGQAAA